MDDARLDHSEHTSRTAWLKGLATVAVIVALAACGGSSSSGGEMQAAGLPPAPTGDSISIKVTNNGRSEATLTAQVMGRRVRLGTIQTNRTEVYMLQIRGNEEVSVEIRVLGGGRCTTAPRSVSSGEQIVAIIPPDIGMMPGCR